MVYKTCKNLLQACLCVEQNRCHKSSSLSPCRNTAVDGSAKSSHTCISPKDVAVRKLLGEMKKGKKAIAAYASPLEFTSAAEISGIVRNMDLCNRIAIADVSAARRSCFESVLTAEANLCVWCSCRNRWNVALTF